MAVSTLANRKSAENLGLGASLSGPARLRPAGLPAAGRTPAGQVCTFRRGESNVDPERSRQIRTGHILLSLLSGICGFSGIKSVTMLSLHLVATSCKFCYHSSLDRTQTHGSEIRYIRPD